MSALGHSLGTVAHAYADKEDAKRVKISAARAHGSTREGRMDRRQLHLNLLEATDAAEGSSYGLGIEDTTSADRYNPRSGAKNNSFLVTYKPLCFGVQWHGIHKSTSSSNR
ncbi:hypothetical protein TNIN_326851 [Trichonephila inaurata madagascariensis]|uniref:Uncharacterized protein n=1 Tax=Trichonephila inaurata madagascariensis TaxID=2747483 RepID=A0A8X6WPN4_9ARAC|nr:hypothetical protein TNIN_326851 [Trichonephila inaurata madagascariensis]